MLGFLSMSLTSSAVYAINDAHDAPQDRLHPDKRHRPIASGEVTPAQARWLAAACIALAVAFPLLSNVPARSLWPLALYILANFAYSELGLKDIPIVDVSIVALGFVLRVIYGGLLAGVEVSNWLLLTVMMASYYMALGKRRNELRDVKDRSRTVLTHYTYDFLDKQMYLFLTLTVAFYSLWSVNERTAPHAVLSVPVIILLLMRYNLMVEGRSNGDPIEIFVHDRFLLVLAALFVLMMFGIIYLQGGIGL